MESKQWVMDSKDAENEELIDIVEEGIGHTLEMFKEYPQMFSTEVPHKNYYISSIYTSTCVYTPAHPSSL